MLFYASLLSHLKKINILLVFERGRYVLLLNIFRLPFLVSFRTKMSESLYERFLGYDWGHYAGQAAKLASITSLVLGLIAIFMHQQLFAGSVSVFAGCFLAIWEVPYIYFWYRNFEAFRTYIEESFYFRYEETKAGVCLVLAFLCFHAKPSVVELSGALLMLTAVLYMFAAINRRADANARNELNTYHHIVAPSNNTSFPPVYQPIPSETTALPKTTYYLPQQQQQQQRNAADGQFGTFQQV
jgi:hypothetical protein